MRLLPPAVVGALTVSASLVAGLAIVGNLPAARRDLPWAAAEPEWWAASWFFAAAAAVVGARAFRHQVPRWLALVALAVLAVLSVLAARVEDFPVALALRTASGFAGGLVLAFGCRRPSASAARWPPAAAVLGAAAALAAGTWGGSSLTEVAGWRAVQLAAAGLAGVALVTAASSSKAGFREPPRFRWRQASLAIMALGGMASLVGCAHLVIVLLDRSSFSPAVRTTALMPGSLGILAGAILAAAGQRRVPRHAVRIAGAWMLFVAAALLHLRAADWDPGGLGLLFLLSGAGLGLVLASDGRDLMWNPATLAAMLLGAGAAIAANGELLLHRAGARLPLDPVFDGSRIAESDAALIAAGAGLVAFLAALVAPVGEWSSDTAGSGRDPDADIGFAWREAM